MKKQFNFLPNTYYVLVLTNRTTDTRKHSNYSTFSSIEDVNEHLKLVLKNNPNWTKIECRKGDKILKVWENQNTGILNQ